MMPTSIDEIFQPLHNEVLDIHLAWRLYRQAFATTEERVILLNRYASVWFGYAEVAMYDDVVVSIFRLLDPADSGKGRENLTLARLADVVEADAQMCLAEAIRVARGRVKNLLQPFTDWRNKRCAHNDLARMQAACQGNPTTPGPSCQIIEESLAGVRQCMNNVYQHYQDGICDYENIFIPGGDGEDLIKHLKRYDQHLEELRDGAPTPQLRRNWPDLSPDVQDHFRDAFNKRKGQTK